MTDEEFKQRMLWEFQMVNGKLENLSAECIRLASGQDRLVADCNRFASGLEQVIVECKRLAVGQEQLVASQSEMRRDMVDAFADTQKQLSLIVKMIDVNDKHVDERLRGGGL